ncbi:ABC transporter substrate-binding protein [Pseudaquabacterium pictum]|uniref:Sugar ABC transporter substrate-binding protein n=1 Tax=Pseudaquabacterium pictum TaxID=2315236 RepID=A0A480AJC9_9BURK|nr:ABC transporter substrate-binding protein [Rubrivivax pictus]GCL61573.1 sugar ABC transporter substrate-binding protein [Rubrivivax pictus]
MLKRRALLAAAAGAPVALQAPWVHAQPQRVLRMAWWGGAGRHAATLKALALFEQRHPGVRIKAEYMGFNGYLERLTAQVAGGSEPDVMQINWAWLAMFSKRGNGFTDLDAHAARLPLDQFAPADLQLGRVAGKLNALPVSYTARVLLWNQHTFARAGLPLPAGWDELFAAGERLRAALGPQHYPLDGELYDMMLLAQAWVQQRHGMAYVHPTEARVGMTPAAAQDWVRIYRQLIDRQVATPLPLRASLGGAEKPTEQQADWTTGRWAGNYAWDSVIALRSSTLPKDQPLALGRFPRMAGALDSGMFGRPSLMYAVGRNCREPDLAAALIGHLLADPEAARLLGRTRGVPAARGPFQALVAGGQLPPLELAAHEQIQQQRRSAEGIGLPNPLFEHARLHRLMREVFETVAYGKASDADAARRLVDEGNAMLRRIR